MFGTVSGVFWFLGGLFWLWMLISCLRSDPERYVWVWILLFVNVPFTLGPVGLVAPLGAFVYFIIRWLPQRRGAQGNALFRSWTLGGELKRLEAATRQIGNAHQFVEYADALRSVGRDEQAGEAYDRALAKDPKSLPALWGKALVLVKQQHDEQACDPLKRVLAIDPGYKFGDVSLAYARILVKLKSPEAREYLERHVRRWKQPEAVYQLAELLAESGEATAARDHLESLMLNLRGAPTYFARQNRVWKNKAQRLLNQLPTDST